MAVSNDIMCVLFPLQAAGNAVKRASDNLVRAAQKAAFGKADDDDVVVKTKFVGGIAQVCDHRDHCIVKALKRPTGKKSIWLSRMQT